MRICLFEDRRASDLAPLTLTRPAFDLLCGLTPLADKPAHYFAPDATGFLVRPLVADLVREDHPHAPVNDPIWLRAAGRLPDDPLLHTCVLAYATDFNLLSTALLPHGKSWFAPGMIVASIDHALWFHRDVRVDDWLLYSMDAPTSQGARGFSRGSIYDRAGRLVCSVTQENLMRYVPA